MSGGRRSVARGAADIVSPLVVFLLAFAVRIMRLGSESLWVDEGFSLRDSVELTVNGAYRPVYYLFLRFWHIFGHSESWLRLPSALFGAGAVALLFLLTRRLLGHRTALGAALLMCFAIPDLSHSQEVRMYALASFLALLCLWCLRLWYESPSLWRLCGHVAAGVVAILTTPTAASVVLPPAVWVALRCRFAARQRAALAVGWIAGAAAVGVLAAHLSEGLAAFSRLHRAWISPPRILEATALPARMVLSELQLLDERGMTIVVALVCLGLVAASLFGRGSKGTIARWLTLWFFACAGTLMVFSHLVTPVWIARYFHTMSPLIHVLLVLGVGAVGARLRIGGIALTAFLAGVIGFALARYFTVPQRDDWRGAASWVRLLEQPADRVCLVDGVYAPVWDYYRGTAVECAVAPVLDPETGLPLPQPTLASVPRSRSRVFLVMRRSARFADLPDQLARSLEEDGRLLGQFASTKVEVLVLRPSG